VSNQAGAVLNSRLRQDQAGGSQHFVLYNVDVNFLFQYMPVQMYDPDDSSEGSYVFDAAQGVHVWEGSCKILRDFFRRDLSDPFAGVNYEGPIESAGCVISVQPFERDSRRAVVLRLCIWEYGEFSSTPRCPRRRKAASAWATD